MTKPPLLVLISVDRQHTPLVDTLEALGIDIGSIGVATLAGYLESREPRAMLAELAPDTRFLCIATADAVEMVHTMARLADALVDIGYESLGRVVLFAGPMETSIAAFLDVPCLAQA